MMILKWWKFISFFLAVGFVVTITQTAMAQNTPNISKPHIFAPGVISGSTNDGAPTFTPDGNTVYFFRDNSKNYVIMMSHRENGHWSEPKVVPFSGVWRDLDPILAPDGSYLIFATSRPTGHGNKQIDGYWRGHIHPGWGGNLWRVTRTKDGWSRPVLLPEAINDIGSVFSSAIDADGSLYFMVATGKDKNFQIYVSHFNDGTYQPAHPLPFSTDQWMDIDPAVAPDQSFIVFLSNRPPTPKNHVNLFIAFHNNGQWGKPIDLGLALKINKYHPIAPRLGPDGNTLYFSSSYVVPPSYPKSSDAGHSDLRRMEKWNNKLDNIWTVDLGPWLKMHQKQTDN